MRGGAFAREHGTVLSVIGFSEDVLVPAADQDDLYAYLTGGGGSLYRTVTADDAEHSMYMSNPTGLVAALRGGML